MRKATTYLLSFIGIAVIVLVIYHFVSNDNGFQVDMTVSTATTSQQQDKSQTPQTSVSKQNESGTVQGVSKQNAQQVPYNGGVYQKSPEATSSNPETTDIFTGTFEKVVGNQNMGTTSAEQFEVSIFNDPSHPSEGDVSGTVLVSYPLSNQEYAPNIGEKGVFYVTYNPENAWYVVNKFQLVIYD